MHQRLFAVERLVPDLNRFQVQQDLSVSMSTRPSDFFLHPGISKAARNRIHRYLFIIFPPYVGLVKRYNSSGISNMRK